MVLPTGLIPPGSSVKMPVKVLAIPPLLYYNFIEFL